MSQVPQEQQDRHHPACLDCPGTDRDASAGKVSSGPCHSFSEGVGEGGEERRKGGVQGERGRRMDGINY